MKQQLIVDEGPFETRIALLEDGQLAEYTLVDPSAPAPGVFCRGKILRVDKSLDAAFVDIGESLPAFLPRAGGHYRQGDLCLVQIEALPSTETKGLRLTDKPLLTGRYMVLRPGMSGVRVSSKLPGNLQRIAKQFAEARCPEGFGMIVRTDWRTLTRNNPEPFDRELRALLDRWEAVKTSFGRTLAPGRVTGSPEVQDICRGYLDKPGTEIYVNSRSLYDMLASERSISAGQGAAVYDRCADGPLIFDPFQIDTQVERALHRKLWLKSGGFLVVDYTEAFTVYDVNSGKDVRKLPPEEKAYAVNLEAVRAVLAHLRLCNIGGIILVDLIDMKDPGMREALLGVIRTAAAPDHGNIHEEGITSLGILQLTRRRTGLPLYKQMETVCHACQGAGRQPLDRQTEGEIRRNVARRVRSGQSCAFRISCSREVEQLIRRDPFFENIKITIRTDRNYTVESMPGTAVT